MLQFQQQKEEVEEHHFPLFLGEIVSHKFYV